MRRLACLLLVLLAGCIPTVIPAPVPQPRPAPVPPVVDPADAKWEALLDIQTKAAAGPVTEAEVDAALGAHVPPAPYTQPRAPFHRIVSYAVRSSDGKASLRAHAHFLDGKLVTVNIE